jgi:two-component system nitrogen regulation response regulator NtrX
VTAKTILIVDDDLAFSRFLDDVLTGAGYETSVAKHGAAAFLDLEITHPDLILVDVFMPIIDGITFCRMVRAQRATRDTPIIMMSATADLHTTIPVQIAGFLAKPLDIDALLHLIARLVEEPAGERPVSA